MRTVRNALTLAAVAASAIALAAPTASATSQTEVTKADGATHCPTLPAGGCKIHIEGEMTTFFHIFGFEGSEWRCHVELRGTSDEDGNGQITTQTVTPGNHDADCTNATQPACSLPWPWAAEKDADGVVRSHYDLCFDPAESGMCSGEFITAITESGVATEVQTQTATDLRIGTSFCELSLSFTSEAIVPDSEETHVKSI